MGEVMRWKLKGFLPGVDGVCSAVMRPEVVLSLHYDAERLRADTAVADANDAERKLAALREELANVRNALLAARNDLGFYRDKAEAAEQRNAILEAEIKKLTPWVKGVGSTKLRDHAYQLIASAPCEKCKGKGFIDFTDKDLRNANNGAWGRCLTCRPYDVSLTKPTESGASNVQS